MKKGMFITHNQQELLRALLKTRAEKNGRHTIRVEFLLDTNRMQEIDGDSKDWILEEITKLLRLHQQETIRKRRNFMKLENGAAAGKTKTIRNLLYKISQCPI